MFANNHLLWMLRKTDNQFGESKNKFKHNVISEKEKKYYKHYAKHKLYFLPLLLFIYTVSVLLQITYPESVRSWMFIFVSAFEILFLFCCLQHYSLEKIDI